MGVSGHLLGPVNLLKIEDCPWPPAGIILEKYGSWLVDSGCSAHITFYRSLFVTYEHMQSGSVEMGTKAKANIAGRGEVEIMLNVNGSPHP